MKIENRLARLMRNSGYARFLLPVGAMLIAFGVLSLGMESDGGPAVLTPPVFIAAGIVAAAAGIFLTARAFRKSRELDAAVPNGGAFPALEFADFKNAPDVTEYYFRFDGNSLRPGYILEDAAGKPVFEGKMLKNSLVGARKFEFRDHVSGSVTPHNVGHTMTSVMNNEFFSVRSSFRFDGQNVWDVLHGRGLRMTTDLHSSFPKLVYEVARNGEPFARFESSSVWVHEEDEAAHGPAVPAGSMFYRVWTNSDDFDTLFLTVFAVSETGQAVVE